MISNERATGALFGDDKLKFWDAQTGQELFFAKQSRDVWLVAFSADGHKLAVVTGRPAHVTIYDATPLPEMPSP